MTDQFIATHKAKHLLSHVLVAAGAKLWPGVSLGESGETKTGFYADFAMPQALGETELEQLTDEMARILLDSQNFRDVTLSVDEAREVFEHHAWKSRLVEAIAETEAEVRCSDLDGVLDVCDCAIKDADELRQLHPEKFELTGSHPVVWSHRGKEEMFVRVQGQLFPAPEPCACCRD